MLKNSVADPGCLSRIPDPDFYPSRIPDPGSRIPDPKTATKERGEKKIWCHTFLFSHKFHKIVHYFSFEVLKKKIWTNFQTIIELFAQKIVTKLSKVWVWDPGSGIRDPGSGKNLFRIPDPGVKKALDPGSRIRIRNTAKKYTEVWKPVIRIWVRYSHRTAEETVFEKCSKSDTVTANNCEKDRLGIGANRTQNEHRTAKRKELTGQVKEPDPHDFGPPGSEIRNRHYFIRIRIRTSINQQKKEEKPWFLLSVFVTFLFQLAKQFFG
jgi:hypothetical protein